MLFSTEATFRLLQTTWQTAVTHHLRNTDVDKQTKNTMFTYITLVIIFVTTMLTSEHHFLYIMKLQHSCHSLACTTHFHSMNTIPKNSPLSTTKTGNWCVVARKQATEHANSTCRITQNILGQRRTFTITAQQNTEVQAPFMQSS
jgi:hypothetical protein